MSRLTPKLSVVKILLALSGNRCAFPDCNHSLVTDKGNFIGELCHIEAANKKGPRFNPNQTEEQRRAAANLLFLCPIHHKQVDDYPNEYTVTWLKSIKQRHEQQFRQRKYEVLAETLEKVYHSIEIQIEKLLKLSEDTNTTSHKIDNAVNTIDRKMDTVSDKIDFLLVKFAMQSTTSEDNVYTSQLEAIKALKNQGKFETAIDMLIDFKRRYWNQLNAETKYKLVVNIGMSYLDIHKKEKAARYLQMITKTGYETANSLANLCLGYAIDIDKQSQFDWCFKKAFNIDPDNQNLWVAYIERYKEERAAELLLNEVPESIRDTVPILFTIGGRMINEGNKIEGVALLKKALEKLDGDTEKGADIKAAIGTNLIRDLVDPFKFLYNNYSKEELSQLEEAKGYLTEAWDIVGKTELAKYKWFVILNRGVINKITGKLKEALPDFEKAFELSNEFVAFKNLLFLYIQMDRLDFAQDLMRHNKFAQQLNEEEAFELKTFKARLLFLKGDTKGSITQMQELLDENKRERFKEISIHIVAMAIERKEPDIAATVSDQLIEKFPALSLGYLYYGYVWMLRKNKEKAIEYFDKASQLLDGTISINDLMLLANGYMDLSEFEKAIPIFERGVNKTILNDFSRGLIQAYFSTGDDQAAKTLAEDLFHKNPESVYLAEVLSEIYNQAKLYDRAIEILEMFIPSDDDHVNDVFSYRCAKMYREKNEPDRTRDMTLRIRHPENFEQYDIFTFAWLLVYGGEFDRALEVAFDARTRYFDDGNAHYNYFRLCTEIQKDEKEIYQEEVKTNCAVHITMDKIEEKTFLITDRNARGENVLRPDDLFAKQLVGKKIGDEITVGSQYGSHHTVSVTGMIDIYTYALRETLKLLDFRFAGQQPIGSFRFDPERPMESLGEVIKNTLKKDMNKQPLDLYREGKATAGMLAYRQGRNHVMGWFALMSANDVSIVSFTRDEYGAVHHALSSHIPIVLDLTALITLFLVFRKTNLLEKIKSPFIVSQETIKELHLFFEELGQHSVSGLLMVDYQDGKLVSHFTPKEIIQDHQHITKEIITWCEMHAQIAVSTKQIEYNRNDRKKYSEVLGECFFDTMLLAEEHQAAVLSDDDHFKNLMRAGKTPAPFCTYELAHWLLGNGMMTKETFDEFRTVLIQANFIYIPVTNDVLWKCFDASAFQLRRPFTVAVKGLNIMLLQPCASELAKFLKQLYLSKLLAGSREQIILFVLNEVFSRKDYSQLKRILPAFIQREFFLLPQFKKNVLELINTFR
jgi:tetratricopeptide (TPR) repeat protein